MTTLSQLVDQTLIVLSGQGLPTDRASFLSTSIDTDDLILQVNDGENFAQGVVQIEDELLYVESVSDNTLTLAADGRGWLGTTAAAHASGKRVTADPTWPRVQIENALNDAIEGTYPDLFGVAQATFTWNAVQNTYNLPSDCEKVLEVSADTLGPTQEQEILRRWAFNGKAPSQFAGGRSITIQEPVFPGRVVTVTYRKRPTAITSTDAFTVSGLAETAKIAVKYAACSELLAYLDSGRLTTGVAQANEYDTTVTVGTAAKLSAQLYQRYAIELGKERERLEALTPTPVHIRTR